MFWKETVGVFCMASHIAASPTLNARYRPGGAGRFVRGSCLFQGWQLLHETETDKPLVPIHRLGREAVLHAPA